MLLRKQRANAGYYFPFYRRFYYFPSLFIFPFKLILFLSAFFILISLIKWNFIGFQNFVGYLVISTFGKASGLPCFFTFRGCCRSFYSGIVSLLYL